MPDFRTVPVPPELSALDAQLAMDAVIQEMSNPAGLKLDEPVADLKDQYKADLRAELAQFPQTLDTQFAAQAIMVEEHIVPPAATIDVVEEPPPLPTLASIEPSTAAALDPAVVLMTATGTGFREEDVIIFAGLSLATIYVSETELQATHPVGSTAGPVSVHISAVAGDSNTLTFTYTDPPGDADFMQVPKDAVTPAQPVAPARAATAPLIGES